METFQTSRMMEKARLLQTDDLFEDVDVLQQPRSYFPQKKKLGAILFVTLCVSLTYSFVITLKYNQLKPDIGRSPYSGLGYDVPTVYHSHTDYWGSNETLSDELWESIDTSPIGIAITDDWAVEHGLPLAGRFPWDDSKGTYFVKAFHQIHCLKLMRKYVMDLRAQRESLIGWSHYQHCLDALRQDVQCRADDTPMYSVGRDSVGDGQVSMCRDWNALVAWTQHPDRNACYRSLSDYRSIEHSLERHAFCPPGSPYYDVSRAYFAKWGHRDPFVA